MPITIFITSKSLFVSILRYIILKRQCPLLSKKFRYTWMDCLCSCWINFIGDDLQKRIKNDNEILLLSDVRRQVSIIKTIVNIYQKPKSSVVWVGET